MCSEHYNILPLLGPFLILYLCVPVAPISTSVLKTLVNSKLDSKWVYMLEVAGDARGWLGKYDDGTTNVVKSLTSGISKEAITEVQNNNAIICVYQAGEAAQVDFINIHLYEEFYKELLSRKINPLHFDTRYLVSIH